ncbi:MAG: hypothetical protein KIT22_05330 [Verrucomicrobiae bacterium]|nr:hypothetical protein [Verrucomicrobiae bacterium]
MKPWLKPQRPNVVLGLSFDGDRLEGVVARRTNGSAEVTQTFACSLQRDPAKRRPEDEGREIRQQLDAAGVRERRCVVALPADWALTLQTPLPDLPEEDVASLLELEAERGFPYGVDSLQRAVSRFKTPEGAAFATQVAILREPIERLEQVLRAARLTPVSFTLGIAALPPVASPSPGDAAEGTATLLVGQASVGLMITVGGGIAALRTLEHAVELEEGEPRISPERIGRELRVTLGQLPAELADAIRRLRIVGAGAAADRLAGEIEARASALGLTVERVSRYAPGELGVQLAQNLEVSPALSVAVRYLAGTGPRLEFLPPRLSPWRQYTQKYASRKLAYAGQAIGAVAAIVALAFGWQEVQLSRLRGQWNGMSARVRELEEMQGQIKRFRPWFDDSVRSLEVLKRLTEVFPENGDVTAKTFALQGSGLVVCTGTARDNSSLLKTLDQLRAASEVTAVQLDQVRGTSPLQFSFNFQWGDSPAAP